MGSPTVTVLMPVFNGGKYIREAVESVLSQTLPDYEFLIIDDGSSDGSIDIARSYRDKRIRILLNGSNLGIEVSLNRGIQEARGKYIARMDADDISYPQRLERQYTFLQNNPDVDVCGTGVEYVGALTGFWQPPASHKEIKSYLLFNNALVHPSVMFRREVFLKNNLLYQEGFSKAEDYFLWSQAVDRVNMSNITEVLLKYRFHPEQTVAKYKSSSVCSADKVRSIMLDKMGMDFTENDLVLHCKIAEHKYEDSMQFLTDSGRWLLKIKRVNDTTKYFHQESLKNLLGEKWFLVCSRARALKWKSWKMFLDNPLHEYSKITKARIGLQFIKNMI
jgi:glycosyltransferase involved in cell wall biosynthesis